MLILPLYGICAIALTGLFLPWIKVLQEPSIALLYSASAITQDCFKDFSDWLQLSAEDAGRVVSRPLSSLPLIVYLPTPSSSNNNIWSGIDDFILLPSDASIATVTQLENSLSLATPFRTHPPHFPPPLPVHESGSVVNNDAGGELTISNDGLPTFLGLVFLILAAFHLVVYVLWKRELAKLDRQADEAKATASKLLEDLSKVKIVLDRTEDSYLKGVLGGLESTTKQSETNSSNEAQINILEHLYVEGDSPCAPSPVLFSVKRWTMSKLGFESTYGAIPSSIEPSTAVPQLPIEESSKRKRSDSDSGSGHDDKGLAAVSDAQSPTRQSDNSDRLAIIHAFDRLATLVPYLHAERPSVRKRPFTPQLARHRKGPQRPPTRPAILDRIKTPAMIDIHAGGPSDTNLGRRDNVVSPSTTVDIRVEGASDRHVGEQQPTPSEPVIPYVPISEAIEPSAMVDVHTEGAPDRDVEQQPTPSEPVPTVPVHETVEPSAMVDTHAEGAPVAKVTGTGGQPNPATDSVRDDGYDSSTSVQTTILAPRTPSAATATTATPARVEVQASPESQTESPQTEQPSGRRRRNRMGQRQRRRLREMRENRGWEQQSSQQGDEGEEEE